MAVFWEPGWKSCKGNTCTTDTHTSRSLGSGSDVVPAPLGPHRREAGRSEGQELGRE